MPPTKLIMCQPVGSGRRLMIEISPNDTITVTPRDGSRQVGKPVQIALAKAPRMAVLVAAVRRALAEQPVQTMKPSPIASPYPAPPAPALACSNACSLTDMIC